MSDNPFVGPHPVPPGKKLFGRDDEAEALCMLMLALREPDALESRTKKRAPRGRRKSEK